MHLNLKTYWKCQLIGWGMFGLITYVGNMLTIPDNPTYLIRAIMSSCFGIVFTHIIRVLIKKLKIFNKKFSSQIVYLVLLTFIVSFIGNFVYIIVYVFVFLQFIADKIGYVREDFTFRRFLTAFILLYSPVLIVIAGWVSIYYLIHYIRGIKMVERERASLQVKLIESEAQALRAQMNPHFIFNCMNSIKALIQNDETQLSIEYLTTFSKLIRTLFQNSDKRQISLFDEIETCRLYTQLEAMRLNGKLKYSFDIDPNLDLKSVMVPALIIQPFIENAIWHGIVPKDEGTIKVTLKGNASAIICEVDDNGIGREMSKLNKPVTPVIHESKGVHLSQVRLDLEKLLNETQATIEIFDKYDNDKSTGTKVILNFNLN